MSNALDMSLAADYGIISPDRLSDDFAILETLGLTTSQSSLMKAASYSCHFNKFDCLGIWLH